MSTYVIPRPASGDIVRLILEDHRLFEDLLRDMRRVGAQREQARQAFAELHVAHARAEEEIVLPKLQRRRAITRHEQHHGEEEHAEAHVELLAVMECVGTDTQKYDEAVEALSNAVTHHLAEEELDVLNSALDQLGERGRDDLGRAWAQRRNELLDAGCASLPQLRRIVDSAEDEGLVEPEGSAH